MPPAEGRGADSQVVRHMVTRLAVVAVQGEQLQALCDELEPLLHQLRREPQLEPAADILARTLEAVAGVAGDIARVTEALGQGLQQAGRSSTGQARDA
jgi:ABC-type transporter Mla subunit MlaD